MIKIAATALTVSYWVCYYIFTARNWETCLGDFLFYVPEQHDWLCIFHTLTGRGAPFPACFGQQNVPLWEVYCVVLEAMKLRARHSEQVIGCREVANEQQQKKHGLLMLQSVAPMISEHVPGPSSWQEQFSESYLWYFISFFLFCFSLISLNESDCYQSECIYPWVKYCVLLSQRVMFSISSALCFHFLHIIVMFSTWSSSFLCHPFPKSRYFFL